MITRCYLEITNICNLDCLFCPKTSRPKKRLLLQEFNELTDKLQGQVRFLYFHLMGEPLLHPLLPRFIVIAREKGFVPVLTTNGTLLDRFGDQLLTAGLHKVNISLHSFEAGQEEKHRRYLENAAQFALKARQADILVTFRLWNNGCDGGKNETALKVLEQYFPKPWAENTRGYRIRDGLFLEWGDRFAWPDQNAPARGEDLFCHGLRAHFGILSDGTVVPCCMDSDGVIALGNVFRQELSDILASPRAKAIADGFQRRKATEDLCRRCGYARKF